MTELDKVKSMDCNPIWRTNWWCDVTLGKHYIHVYHKVALAVSHSVKN